MPHPLGEFELIARYFSRPAPHADLGVGDDCALLPAPSATEQLAISTDMLIEGRHFLAGTDAEALGHKALAVNLSDLAAMGATPLAFTLALALPDADPRWLDPFSRGLYALADRHGIELVGGDTTRGPRTICITVLGTVPRGQALLRSGAREGDDIWISGTVGDARLALGDRLGEWSIDAAARAAAYARMDRPEPRVGLAQALRGIAHAAIDVSDGLLADLGHVLERSRVGATVEVDRCPASPALATQPLDRRRRCQLAGGDDYELLFTASPQQRDAVDAAGERSLLRVTRIGRIEADPGLRLVDANGRGIDDRYAGFDHFRSN